MSDDITKQLPEILNQVLARLDSIGSEVIRLGSRMEALETKVDERLHDTRPMWEALQAQITELQSQMAALSEKAQSQITGMSEEMQSQINGLREAMLALGNMVQAQINGLREDVQAQINGLREDVQAQINGLREEMKDGFIEIESRLDALSIEFNKLGGKLLLYDRRLASLESKPS